MWVRYSNNSHERIWVASVDYRSQKEVVFLHDPGAIDQGWSYERNVDQRPALKYKSEILVGIKIRYLQQRHSNVLIYSSFDLRSIIGYSDYFTLF